MVRAEVVRRRLNKLDEYLAILSGLQRYSYDDFMGSPERYGSTERFLHLAIELVNDLGNHVIADDGLGMVETYADIPRLLAANGYIDEALADKWIGMVGFRNILVHNYLDIDRGIVYRVLRDQLDDFVDLRRFFAGFLIDSN